MSNSKIIFRYSGIYDWNWKEWTKFYVREPYTYPSPKRVRNYMIKVEKLWRKDEKRIMTELSKAVGLKWREKFVYCYVVGRCRPFSDPLTMKVYDDYPADYFTDVLTHELVHQLFIQGDNEKKSWNSWKYFHEKYKKEPFNTRIHIPVHALHKHIFLEFFTDKRLKREIASTKNSDDYKRAWEIVEKDGYRQIIQEFKNRIK